jgi:hypothetical protein
MSKNFSFGLLLLTRSNALSNDPELSSVPKLFGGLLYSAPTLLSGQYLVFIGILFYLEVVHVCD